jgi:hypothetical protein
MCQEQKTIVTADMRECLSALERERQERESRIEVAAKIKNEIEEQRFPITSSISQGIKD